jgi:hypothetical protein
MALEDVIRITDITILCLLILIEGFVFVSLKFKVDFSGIVTLVLHFVVSALRVVNSVRFSGYRNIIQVLSSCLIWISLYYFTYEMYFICATLSSENPKKHEKLKKRILIEKIVLIGYQSLFMVLFEIQTIFLVFKKPTYEQYYNLFSIFSLVIAAIKFVSDVYLLCLFP